MVFEKEASISGFKPFNQGTADPDMKDFLEQCEKTVANKKPLNVQQLEQLVRQFQFRIDWYKTENLAGNVRNTLTNLPIKWTAEYREHMGSRHAKDPAFAPLREWMKTQMRASKTTNLSDFEKLQPGASKGAADPKAAPKSAPSAKEPAKAGAVRAKHTAQPKSAPQAAPKPQADGGPKDSAPLEDAMPVPTSFAKVVLQRLEPPVNIYFVRPSGKQSYYLAINPADADKESLDKNSGEFTEYLDWYYTEWKGDDHDDDDDEEAGHPEETDKERKCKKFFTNEYGFDNFLLCKVNHDPAEWPDEEKIDTELHDYLVTKTMIHDYIEVAVNQYRDNGNPGMTNALIDARDAFLDTDTQSEYLKYKKKMREEAEAKAKADKLRIEKKQFLDTFHQQTTPAEIKKRHEVYMKLREAGVLDADHYFNLLRDQIKAVQNDAGIEGENDLDMRAISRGEMQELLHPFTNFCPGYTQATLGAYLDARDKNLALYSTAGSLPLNQQFEDEHGMTVEEYVKQSQAPGVWKKLAGVYKIYKDMKKVMDKQADELRKRLEQAQADHARKSSPSRGDGGVQPQQAQAAGGSARKRLPDPSRSPSPTRDGDGMLPPSGRGSPRARKSRTSATFAGIDPENQVPGRRGRTPSKHYHAGAASRNGSPKPRPLA